MATGVNYTVFQRYIELLEARGIVRLVSHPSGGEAIELTAKGDEALNFLAQGIERLAGQRGDPAPH
jgi:predicted transcriptional regulator